MTAEPTVRAVRRLENALEIDLYIPRSLVHFIDHFPRLAILPGVVQLDWAIRHGREHFAIEGAFRAIRNLKFVNPVLPETTLTLELQQKPGELAFHYRDASRSYSSGRVLFA